MFIVEKASGEPQGRPEDFHEVWWITSDRPEPWAGLRIAHFRKTVDGTLILIILGEVGDRIGVRIWEDVSKHEGWRKVERIPIPKGWQHGQASHQDDAH